MKRLALFLAVPLLAACSVFGAPALPTLAPESLITPTDTNTPSPPTNTPGPTFTPSHIPVTSTYTPTNTLIPTDIRATETNTPSPPTNIPEGSNVSNAPQGGSEPCAWSWATQEQPELSAQMADEIIAAGLADVTVKMTAYGENCNTTSGSRFGAMSTDMTIIVQVEDVNDREQANQAALTVLTVLKNYGRGVTPGPNSGNVTIKLITGTQQALISKRYDQFMAGLTAYSAGDDLLSDLGVMMTSTLP